MSVKGNETLVRRAFNLLSSAQGDIVKFKNADWGSMFSSDYIFHSLNGDMNLEQYIQYMSGVWERTQKIGRIYSSIEMVMVHV